MNSAKLTCFGRGEDLIAVAIPAALGQSSRD